MRTVIIPDIHGQVEIAEAIISYEEPDEIIFLGDYFDFFGDTFEDADNIAAWLNNSLKKENRIHLIGNHDISYMSDNMFLKCTGWKSGKHKTIARHDITWGLLKLYHWKDDWLCSHAGLSRTLVSGIRKDNINEVLKLAEEDMNDLDNPNKSRPFLEAGYSRGGPIGSVGGILWCDYAEFVDIPGVKQIFGHTRDDEVRMNKNHICLDTGLHNYAVYENGKMNIKNVKQHEP